MRHFLKEIPRIKLNDIKNKPILPALCMTLALLTLSAGVGVTYARYVTSAGADASAHVAGFVVEAAATATDQEKLYVDGDNGYDSYKFTVSNNNANSTSEVAMTYEVIVTLPTADEISGGTDEETVKGYWPTGGVTVTLYKVDQANNKTSVGQSYTVTSADIIQGYTMKFTDNNLAFSAGSADTQTLELRFSQGDQGTLGVNFTDVKVDVVATQTD